MKTDDCVSGDRGDSGGIMNDKMGSDIDIADNDIPEERVICQFKHGMCTQHNKIKGTKVITKTKKWAKKRHDYGWVTSQKTMYT